MKIGLFFGYAPPEIGAPVARARSLARFLNEDRGYETVAFAPSRERDQGFHDGVYRYSDRYDLAAGIRQMKLDGAVVSSPPLDIARWSAKELKKQGIPFTADIRDPAVTQIWSTPGGRAGKFLKSFKAWLKEELLIRDAESSVAVSQYLRDQTQRNHPTSARKMSVAANGADPEIFWPRKSQERSDIRVKYNLPSDDKIIVYSGTIGPEFELKKFISTSAKTIRELEVTFLIIAVSNSAAEITALQDTADSAGIADRLIIRSNISQHEVSELVAASDLGLTGISNRYKYAIQIKLYEYLMCGIPLVAKGPHGGGLHGVFLNDDRAGWFFDSWNAMSESLPSALSQSKIYRDTLSDSGSMIAERYSRKPANQLTADLLNRSLS